MKLSGPVLAVLASVAVAAPASAAEPLTHGYFDEAGDPTVSAYVPTWVESTSVLEWRSCPSNGASCRPLPESAYVSPCSADPTRWTCHPLQRSLGARLGETPAGTSFEAVYDRQGVITTVRLPVWNGRVEATTAPALQGDAVVGETLRPLPASWSGGWSPGAADGGADHSRPRIVACPRTDGGDCFVIGFGSATLTQRWAGWYVFAVEVRHPAGTVHGMGIPPLPYPEHHSSMHTRGTVAVSEPAGPVCCAPPASPPARTVTPAPVAAPKPPNASIRARAYRRQGRLVVGRVTCSVLCDVRLTVRGGGRTVQRSLRVLGTKALTVPPRRGKLRVRMTVNGKLLSTGNTLAR